MGSGRRKPGWTRVAFGDVATCANDRIDNPVDAGVERYVGLEHLDSDSLVIRRWGFPAAVTATKLLFRKGDIIFGRRRVYQRKLAVADFDGICSAHALVLRAKSGAVLPRFLPFFMQSDAFMERAKAISVGSLSPTINWRTLASEEFALPPLDEQHRLASVLTAVMEASQTCSHLEHALIQTELGAIQTGLDRNRHRPAVPVVDLLREPPRNGISPSPIPFDEAGRAGLKTVSISAVDRGRFDPTNALKCVEIEGATARPFLVREGDAFIVRGNGNRKLCGRAGLADMSYDDLVYPDLLIRLRFDPTRILPAFAVAQWNLPAVHRGLSARAKSTNGIWKVNGQDVRAHRLVVPSLSDQRRSLRVITRMRTLGDVELKRRTDGLARLRNILLNSWATSGE